MIVPVFRSPIAVTVAVWKALFLREAISRLAAGRVAWLWMLVDPIVHLIFLMALFEFFLHRVISGIDGAMFIATGVLGFFMARNTAMQCMGALSANAALFTYRQVKPVDTVFVRIALEGLLALLSAILLLSMAALVGFDVLPSNPLLVALAITGLWLSGAGLGLLLSAAGKLVPAIDKVARMLFRPLYFISGVMMPAMTHSQPVRELLFYNPLMHGLELLRSGFFVNYPLAPEASASYLYGFALVTIFLGLALHVRFADRMAEQE